MLIGSFNAAAPANQKYFQIHVALYCTLTCDRHAAQYKSFCNTTNTNLLLLSDLFIDPKHVTIAIYGATRG